MRKTLTDRLLRSLKPKTKIRHYGHRYSFDERPGFDERVVTFVLVLAILQGGISRGGRSAATAN